MDLRFTARKFLLLKLKCETGQILPAYEQEPGLCEVKAYRAYIVRTKSLRKGPGSLFITTIKPFGPIARDTFGKWVKTTLTAAGVDMRVYGTHSTRSAATSTGDFKGVPFDTILHTAGWVTASTFTRMFYQKPEVRSGEFAQSVMTVAGD